MKKVLWMFLFNIFVFCAYGYDFEVDGYKYNIISPNERTVAVVGTANNGDIEIPSTCTYNGKAFTVVSIGSNAFISMVGITSVTLPNTITSIGDAAFKNCTALVSIYPVNSVTKIGKQAFLGCTGLSKLSILNVVEIGSEAFQGSGITDISLSDSLQTIASRSFEDCVSLKFVAIPNSVKTIGSRAFSRCGSLQSVNIGNNVERIGEYAFEYCPIYNLTIPSSVSIIENNAFNGCTKLSNIIIEESSNPLKIEYSSARETNVITTWHYYPNFYNSPITTLHIGRNIRYDFEMIAKRASTPPFSNLKSITSVYLGDSITEIGSNFFKNCDSISTLKLPDSVVKIGENALYGCSSLSKLTIGKNVTDIGSLWLEGCQSLSKIYCYAERVPKASGTMTSSIIYAMADLYVPKESIDAYKADKEWGKFPF